MKNITVLLFGLSALANAFAGPGQEAKMAWFREAKFGMFIHWGLYSVAAGEWKGETGHGEWIQYTANISCSEYDPLAKQFNPTGFNSDEWAGLAKNAGMNYMIITAKHHDGFCMYDSQWTDFDIVDATPYKKDPMKDLAASCRKEGLKFCFYYSVKDWHHPEYHRRFTRFNAQHPEGFHGNPNPDADAKKYIAYMGNQLEELLTNYGEIGVIWFDYGGRLYNRDSSNIPHGQRVVDRMREIQPNILINGRMGGGIAGDYGTPEQTIPGSKSTSPFEVCMTLSERWGYSREDKEWKDAKTVIRNLADICGKGGNYLLNIAPTGEGIIPQEARDILTEVGRWLEINGEAIYGTTPGGPGIVWNKEVDAITTKPGRWYIHMFDWPEKRKVFFEKIDTKVKKAYLLADKKKTPVKLEYFNDNTSILAHLPEQPADPYDSVLVFELEE